MSGGKHLAKGMKRNYFVKCKMHLETHTQTHRILKCYNTLLSYYTV